MTSKQQAAIWRAQAEALTGRRVRFRGWHCVIVCGQYSRGGISIVLHDDSTHERVAVATLNPCPPGRHELLGDDEVVIKDYSENEGMLAALEKAGIMAVTGRTLRLSRVDAPICRLILTASE